MTSHQQPGESTEEENGEPALESAEADSAEQRADIAETPPDWMRSGYPGAGTEASEADTVEQLQEVELDEDDYR
ncbi:hypothetical protein F4561_000712 [Lipingzhangella halophila]|uniref:Uncharacterized protein n=1 Tax=Lipingzhangella halophila TaxID=1783352 RepID=A0A7W7W0G8_9ACTN|nr:hypothetical protein [Lipingzhangella halophila]MBB4929892.1 hypothetical protein [Lipingzhangella halophila]